jgi:hypothetical protein
MSDMASTKANAGQGVHVHPFGKMLALGAGSGVRFTVTLTNRNDGSEADSSNAERIRRQWMQEMGLPAAEIDRLMAETEPPTDASAEQAHLDAARRIRQTPLSYPVSRAAFTPPEAKD